MNQPEYEWIDITREMNFITFVLQQGKPAMISISGKNLCVVKSGSEYFGVNDKCPHAGASLSQGWCVNQTVVCPHHQYKFDLRTGRTTNGEGYFVQPYPIRLEEEKFWIGFEKKRGWFS